MPIQYTSILERIKELLDNGLPGVAVRVDPPAMGETVVSEVGIILATEENTERILNSDDPYTSILNVLIYCSEYSPDGVSTASRRRDALVGQVRDLLKTDRTLGGLVDITQLGNIEFDSSESRAGFFSAALITLRCYVTS